MSIITHPILQVSFEESAYTVAEGESVTVTVELSADPEREIIIPITVTNKDGATSAHYSGVPSSLTFASGETSKTISFLAAQDSVDDDGQSVDLSFDFT